MDKPGAIPSDQDIRGSVITAAHYSVAITLDSWLVSHCLGWLCSKDPIDCFYWIQQLTWCIVHSVDLNNPTQLYRC